MIKLAGHENNKPLDLMPASAPGDEVQMGPALCPLFICVKRRKKQSPVGVWTLCVVSDTSVCLRIFHPDLWF